MIFNTTVKEMFADCRINAAMLMTLKGEIITVNDAFTQSFGYGHDDLYGKHFSVLFTLEARLNGMPEQELKQVLDRRQSNDQNFLVDKKQLPVWVSGESVLLNNGEEKFVLKIVQDINVQKKTREKFQELNNLNENILSAIEDMVIVMDDKLDLLKANREFYNLFRDMPGQNFSFMGLLKEYDESGIVAENLSTLLHTGQPFKNLRITMQFKNGPQMFNVSGTPLNTVPYGRNILLVMHDITLQQTAEREREDVIGFVAHELRNPLANLTLCNDMMDEFIKSNDIEQITGLVKRYKSNVLRLTRMVGELYDTTRFNSGNFFLQPEWFDFAGMVSEAVDTMQALNPSFKFHLNGDADVMVYADRHRLTQVMTNYLSNAVKYSADKKYITILMKADNQWLTVAVKDYGLGIAPQHLPHIFKRFFRAEKTKKLEGIGLGLYLCCRIIEAHKGKVWAESDEGTGSVFYFSIPNNAEQ